VSTETNILSDERIGGYRYVRTIHPGATSVVMEVVQEATARRLAMKQLLASRAGDPVERKAFEFEAKLGMELRHPNLIRVLDYVKDSGQPYFLMDYFPSLHLRLPIARPAKYDLPRAQIHRIIEQAAAALAYMHDKGWIHRDIKPENILFNKSGEVRVIDFALTMKVHTGLRKLFSGRPLRQGTPSYMSPEQIRREPPAPAADIYSLGITCYELAGGRQPFRANSASELLHKHLYERPTPLNALNKDVSPEYSDLVMTMIQKRACDRLSSLDEFVSRFARVRIFKDDPTPPPNL
jgi:serine/threonine protein kinase